MHAQSFEAEVYKINKYSKEVILRAPQLKSVFLEDILIVVDKGNNVVARIKVKKLLETLAYTTLVSGSIKKIKQGMRVYKSMKQIEKLKKIEKGGEYPAYLWVVNIIYEKDGYTGLLKKEIEIGEDLYIKIKNSDNEVKVNVDDVEYLRIWAQNATGKIFLYKVKIKGLEEKEIEYIKGVKISGVVLEQEFNYEINKVMTKKFEPFDAKKIYFVKRKQGLKAYELERNAGYRPYRGGVKKLFKKVEYNRHHIMLKGGYEMLGYSHWLSESSDIVYGWNGGLQYCYYLDHYWGVALGIYYQKGSGTVENTEDNYTLDLDISYFMVPIIIKAELSFGSFALYGGVGLILAFSPKVEREYVYDNDPDSVERYSSSYEGTGLGFGLNVGTRIGLTEHYSIIIDVFVGKTYFTDIEALSFDEIDNLSVSPGIEYAF